MFSDASALLHPVAAIEAQQEAGLLLYFLKLGSDEGAYDHCNHCLSTI